MKKCTVCGKELPDNAGFCPGCGTKQETTQAAGGSGMSTPPISLTPPPVSSEQRQIPPTSSNGMNIGTLVCGILSIVCAGWVGLILGIVAVALASKAQGEGSMDGKAKAGKICGIIGIVLSALAIVGLSLLGALFV